MAEINQALYQVTHGLYILTSFCGEKPNGQCLDALMQVTNVPPRVAIGVGKKSLTHEMIDASGVFAVNILDRNDPRRMEKIKLFGFQSGRKTDKFASEPYKNGENGSPILSDAKAFFECTVERDKTMDLGTHTLYIGLVTRAEAAPDSEPMTYNEYRRSR